MNGGTWTMITVKYLRLPKETVYNATIDCTEVCSDGKTSVETPLCGESLLSVEMGSIITKIHEILRLYPQAVVTMGPRSKQERLTQLAPDLRDLIRDNLPAALESFAPIHRTVYVRDKEITV